MSEPEGRGAFGGFIGPRTLLGLVANTAPWILQPAAGCPTKGSDPFVGHPVRPSDTVPGALQWRTILAVAETLEPSPEPTPTQRTDYFALCLAAHFATVATYVPTDVDSKIRRALWQDAVGTDQLPKMRELALGLAQWDITSVSARIVHVENVGNVSGHDGERLSVLCGGLLAANAANDRTGGQALESAIDAELTREAHAYRTLARTRGKELDLLRLAAILTHNAGDVMQGFGSAGNRPQTASAVGRFGELARERFERYGGAFGSAAALYRSMLAAEGHRNYPLRKPRALRTDPSLLLPIAPFLDDWGERIARSTKLTNEDRGEIVAALIDGCRKVPGQTGYYRALAGFTRVYPRGLDAPELAAHQTTSVKRALREASLRQKLAVRRESFEASCTKRARTIVG